MKAKDFFAKVWNAVLGLMGSVVLVICCNPLVMFFFNLFFPENAARFVREFIGFNDFGRNFYTKNALKWPLLWSKHWITLKNLKTCGIRKQVAYYKKKRRGEVLKAMSPEAQVLLVQKYPEWMDIIDEQMNLTDEMFAEWMKQIVRAEHKHHSSQGHWMHVYTSLSDHLKRGKSPFSQVMMLAQAAVAEYGNFNSPLMDMLKDYIERFGLSKKQLDEIAQYMSEHLYWKSAFEEEPQTILAQSLAERDKYNHFYNILYEYQVNYEQRVFTRSQQGEKRTDEWKVFCEKTSYICVAAQREMDIEQYKVFYDTGHMLSTEAIVHFLNYPDRNLHRLVFRYEPLYMFEKESLKQFVNDVRFKKVFEEEMAKRKKKQSKRS